MRRITLMATALTLALFCAFLFGCMSLPEASPDKSIIVVPLKLEKKGDFDFFVYYNLHFKDSDKYITVKPSGKYQIISDLIPGEYTIDEVRRVFNNGRDAGIVNVGQIHFVLKPGTITILSPKLNIYVNKSDDPTQPNSYSQGLKFDELSADEHASIVSELSSRKNFEGWQIE